MEGNAAGDLIFSTPKLSTNESRDSEINYFRLCTLHSCVTEAESLI